MAAAQIAKKLKDKRQKSYIEGIFKKVTIKIFSSDVIFDVVVVGVLWVYLCLTLILEYSLFTKQFVCK